MDRTEGYMDNRQIDTYMDRKVGTKTDTWSDVFSVYRTNLRIQYIYRCTQILIHTNMRMCKTHFTRVTP